MTLKKKSILKNILKYFLIFLLTGITILIISIFSLYQYFSKDLPKIKSLLDYSPPQVTEVFSDTNEKIAEFYQERRIVIPLEKMPPYLIQAFIAAEDSRFYEHGGIDLTSIARAFYKNIFAGEIVQGGSTITQQVAKSFFLSPERSYSRKIKEVILAYRIDKYFSKKEILFLYLNQIYLGNRSYGIESAANNYFGKKTKDLSLSESTLLAGLPQAPSRYSPMRHMDRAKKRQAYVLKQMVEKKFINEEQAKKAFDTKIVLNTKKNFFMEKAPYYSEYIRKYILDNYGEKMLYQGGLKIYTALSLPIQQNARKALLKGLYDLDKRQGYRGPIKNFSNKDIPIFLENQKKNIADEKIIPGFKLNAVVTEINDTEKYITIKFHGYTGKLSMENMKWAKKLQKQTDSPVKKISSPGEIFKRNDMILVKLVHFDQENRVWETALEQEPEVSGAILCIESQSGQVKAMVGGKSFGSSQFNRAVQSKRQPGSAFKPIIYSAAIDKGYTPASMIMDNAFVFHDTKQNFTWKPQNYKEKFYGPTLLRKALALSRNLVTIKLMKEIGIDYVIGYAKKMGINTHLDRDLSLALGSSGMSLLELTKAYSIFANEGKMIKPVFIKKIEDKSGNIIEQSIIEPEQIIPQETAYIMTSMLKSVVQNGTGWRAKRLGRPVAGKTGTTNNLHDAWFVGYSTDYISGVWLGFDKEKSLGRNETGSSAACPVWTDFMENIHKGRPKKDFKVPKNIIFQKIDSKTGLLPGPETKSTIFECFVKGTEPEKKSPEMKKIKNKTDFLKYGM